MAFYSNRPVLPTNSSSLKPGVHTNDFAPIHGRRARIHTAPAESTVDSTYCLPQALCEYGAPTVNRGEIVSMYAGLNTLFRLPTRNKTTWMHPRSKHWHLIDYVITRKKGASDIRVRMSMCGAECWTDHRLLVSKLTLRIQPQNLSRG